MSDEYYKDTVKALVRFNEVTSDLNGVLSDTITDAIHTLDSEVEMLLEEYKQAIEKIESLEGELEEMKCQMS